MRNQSLRTIWHWWSEPCGPQHLLRVALPLVISFTSWTIMSFTDRVFLAWYDAACVAAALPAAMLLHSLVALPLGIITFLTTLVGQYEGAGLKWRIGTVLAQGYWTAILVSPLLLLTRVVAEPLFRFLRP